MMFSSPSHVVVAFRVTRTTKNKKWRKHQRPTETESINRITSGQNTFHFRDHDVEDRDVDRGSALVQILRQHTIEWVVPEREGDENVYEDH
jgi:hypothetical protein